MKKSNNVCIWLSTLARGARLQVAQGAPLLDLNGDGGHCRVAWLRVLVLVAALLAGLGDGLAGALDAVIPTLQVDVTLRTTLWTLAHSPKACSNSGVAPKNHVKRW